MVLTVLAHVFNLVNFLRIFRWNLVYLCIYKFIPYQCKCNQPLIHVDFQPAAISILTDLGKINTNISVWYVKTLFSSKNDPNKVGKNNFWKDIIIVGTKRKVCKLRLMLLWFNKWLERELNIFQIIKMYSIHLSCCSKLLDLRLLPVSQEYYLHSPGWLWNFRALFWSPGLLLAPSWPVS